MKFKWPWQTDDSNIPACVDCKHMMPDSKRCRLLTWRKNPVTGIAENQLCETARDNDGGACGFRGKYFEPKPVDKPDVV